MKAEDIKRKRFAIAVLLLITVLWGGTFPLNKTALDHTSPFVFVALRFLLASIIIYPFFKEGLKGLSKDAYKDGLIVAFWFFAGFMTQTIGLKFTTASKSAFITGTFVIFTPIFQTIIEKRPPPLSNIIGIVIVTAGILLMSSTGDDIGAVISELGRNFNFGDFMTLLCAISFGIYIVYLDIVSKKHNFKFVTFSQLFFTGIVALVLIPVMDYTGLEKAELEINNTVLIALGYTIIFATLINLTLQTIYQKEVSPTKAAIIYSFEPIFASLLAFIILGEIMTIFGIAGAIIIFCGLIFSETVRFDWKRKEY